MRWFTMFIASAAISSAAAAELQNVEVNGKIRIRGNVYEDAGSIDLDASAIEQRTRLGVKADFTDSVQAVVELDSYDIWGEDFRSAGYLTGVDARANSADDVEMYQSYIKASELYGTPLSLTVGRQELAFGKQWLFGTADASQFFTGLSWDAVKLAYETDSLTVSAVWAKMAENLAGWTQGDIDLYLLYGSYTGLEDITLDAYVAYIEDDVPTAGSGVDLFTIGLRGDGKIGAFDFNAEAAYQFGDVEDTKFDYGAWGVNLEGGYTLDVPWSPRIFAVFAWLEGNDDNYELAFNRLFSNVEYSEFIDATGDQLSNAFVYSLGVSAAPSENLSLKLAGSYFDADAEADRRGFRWLGGDKDSDLGWELGLYADYKYSEDLVFRAGWAHFFCEGGAEDANIIQYNGLVSFEDHDEEDYDYLFLETEISF